MANIQITAETSENLGPVHQSKWWAIFGFITAVVGVFVIFSAVMAVLAGYVPLGTAMGVLGMISEACAFFLLRQSRNAGSRPIQIKDLRGIICYQEKVKELKDIHHKLHTIERIVNVFEIQIQGKYLSLRDIPKFQQNWERSTREAFTNLRNARYGIKYLRPPYQWEDVLRKQEDLLGSLRDISTLDVPIDKAEEIIHASIRDLLETCRERMFDIDNELKNRADKLSEISSRVFKEQ